MTVVILALGASRRRATVADAQAVIAAGRTPIVVVESLRSWRGDPLPAEAKKVEIAALLRSHPPLRIEHAFLYGLPRRALRIAGRARGAKATAAYEQKFANRVHNRVAALHRRLWPSARTEAVRRAVGGPPDLILVTDPASFTLAAALVAPHRSGRLPTQVAFGSAYALAASTRSV
jgi:hypothetical protein